MLPSREGYAYTCVHMTNYMKLAAARGNHFALTVNDAEQWLFDGNWHSSLQHTEYVAYQGI